MVAAIVRGIPLREALRWPSVNAAAASQQFGAQGGLLRYAELMSLLDAAPPTFTADSL
jgi:sugar/nucleoside kinase (ribokinase family)